MLEMTCSNLSQNYIICPIKLDSSPERPSLGITLPFLHFTMYMPDVHQQQQMNHFSIEVTVLDDKQITRRFRCSTFQSTTSIQADICTFPLRLTQRPIGLKREQLLLPPSAEHDNPHHSKKLQEECEPCWNRVCIPLAEYTHKAYRTKLLETKHLQIHGRRFLMDGVYFAESKISEDELPLEFRMRKWFPVWIWDKIYIWSIQHIMRIKFYATNSFTYCTRMDLRPYQFDFLLL